MRSKDYPSQAELCALFEDAGDTVIWRITASTKAQLGHVVRTRCKSSGYYVVGFKGQRYYVHRVLWIMRNGPLPPSISVDHIDGDVVNNRPSNLRQATTSQNHANMRKNSRNTSGVKGVQWNSIRGQWTAAVTLNGKRHFLGYFDEISDAASAARHARTVLHGEFLNHGEHMHNPINENLTLGRQVGGSHYVKMKIQPVEYAMQAKLDPCAFSILKYSSRHADKNGAQDVEKALHFVALRRSALLIYPKYEPPAEQRLSMETYCAVNRLGVPETRALLALDRWIRTDSEDDSDVIEAALREILDTAYSTKE